MYWGNNDLALIYESEWKSRRSVVSTFAPSKPEQGLQVLFDRYTPSVTPRAVLPMFAQLLDGLWLDAGCAVLRHRQALRFCIALQLLMCWW